MTCVRFIDVPCFSSDHQRLGLQTFLLAQVMLLFQAGDDSHAIRIVFYILHVPIDICAY
jgi:hypothetical protein